MAEVRAALQESLELPTRYARLVAKAPLRLRTGTGAARVHSLMQLHETWTQRTIGRYTRAVLLDPSVQPL